MSRHSQTDLKLTSHSLSERQELLLSQYFDGECGFFRSLRAKRLISRNPAAKDFAAKLEHVRNECVSALTQTDPPHVDLWEKINNRIIQEERAALFLGQRRLEQDTTVRSGQNTTWIDSLLDRIRSPYALAGGVTGGALAALLLVALYRPSEIVSFSAPQTAQQKTMPFVQPVAAGANAYRPRVAAALTQPSLEVDWMRSHGSVKVIPDPNGSSAIIWVRRRQALPSSQRLHSTSRPVSPRYMAHPTATISLIEEQRLDEMTQPGAK